MNPIEILNNLLTNPTTREILLHEAGVLAIGTGLGVCVGYFSTAANKLISPKILSPEKALNFVSENPEVGTAAIASAETVIGAVLKVNTDAGLFLSGGQLGLVAGGLAYAGMEYLLKKMIQ
jgi:hypothetical protein